MIFLATGHRRGGTTYTATLFQKLGYDVQHERWGKHGMCAWFGAVALPEHVVVPWGDGGAVRYQWHQIDQVVHVLRSPIKTMASTFLRDWTIRRDDSYFTTPWHFVAHYVNTRADSVIETTVLGYLGWHKLIRALGPDVTIQIEKVEEVLPAYLNSIGLPVFDRPVDLDRASAEHDQWSREFLEEHCSKTVLEDLAEFCELYGYDPETFDVRDHSVPD